MFPSIGKPEKSPVFKNGSRAFPLNYRPISLTSAASKIMEHITFTNIIQHLERNHYFHASQHGFRKGLSCETQLAAFIHDLHVNLDNNTQTNAIFLDFEKAFHKISHHLLMTKLAQLNLDPHTFSWISDFLTNRNQFVLVNTSSSDTRPVVSGVPQGTVLGPLIYINDLPLNIVSNIRLFADDCVLYTQINSPDDQIKQQADLLTVVNWCQQWQMSLNVSKCKLISFPRCSQPLTCNYTLNNSLLQTADSYKYLGIHLTSDLSWSVHIDPILSLGRKSLGYLQRTLKQAPNNLHCRLTLR